MLYYIGRISPEINFVSVILIVWDNQNTNDSAKIWKNNFEV